MVLNVLLKLRMNFDRSLSEYKFFSGFSDPYLYSTHTSLFFLSLGDGGKTLKEFKVYKRVNKVLKKLGGKYLFHKKF